MFKEWCQSCREWKAELKILKSDEFGHWKDINWQLLSSSDWPQSVEEMAKVFVKNTSINFRHGVFHDIGAVMSILINMNIFAIDKTTLKDIKRIRNDFYGHNYTICIHDAEKNIFFENILHFMRLPAVRGYQSAIKLTPALEELQKCEHLTQKLLTKLLNKNSLNAVRDVLLYKVPRHVSDGRAIVVQDEMTADSQLYSDYKSRIDELIFPDILIEESEIVDNRPVGKMQTTLRTKLKIKCTIYFDYCYFPRHLSY
ncbi:unnamed protein product [Mytilus coruscus]|uniref:Uncharacterized protein n=1 Tax=Mytilus coruscus TaxID=42192 RepID=A0A6J8AB48_MYTCO|nr:unnamed protein product [Mytilus coruscus]